MKSVPYLTAILAAAVSLNAATFNPDSAIRHALANNRDLAAARLLVAEAEARLEQGGRLSNPELETELRPNTNGREGVLAFGLTQRFPLTARLRLERSVSRAEVRAASAEVKVAERQVAAQTALAVADWLALLAYRQVREQQLTNITELARAAQAVVKLGEGSSVDARQLELEAVQLATQLRLLDRKQAGQITALRQLLGISAGEPLDLTTSVPAAAATPGVSASSTNARPELQLAGASLETAQRAAELARAQRWQDVGIGLVGEVQRAEDVPVGRRNDGFVGLRLSVPLPFWSRNQGRIRETTVAVERRKLERQALALRVQNEQAAARARLDLAAAVEREIADAQLPIARQIEEQLTGLKAQGQATFTELARAREKRLQLELSQVEATHEVLRAHLQLQTALGQIPQFVPTP